MKIALYNHAGEKVKDLTLSEDFNVEVSDKLITKYINYLRNALRSPVANTKNRGQVSGGGKKPWKQKGTGNARVGSSRSPLWIGGGVTFGPTSLRNFAQRINSKEKKKAILAIISKHVADKNAVIVENLDYKEPKTKKAVELLEKLKVEGKASVIVSLSDKNAILSLRNMAGVHVMTPNMLDILNLISSDKVVISEKALEEIVNNYQLAKK